MTLTMNLLFVDDNVSLAEFTARNIHSLRPSWSISQARSLAEAREISRGLTPTAAVIDVCLPDGSGTELLRELLERQPELPVVMITASPTAAVREEVRKLGGFLLLEKPFAVDLLVSSLEQSISQTLADPELPALIGDEAMGDMAGLDLHQAQNRLSSLLAGIRAFSAEVRAAGLDHGDVSKVADFYDDSLCGIVMDLSVMLARAGKSVRTAC